MTAFEIPLTIEQAARKFKLTQSHVYTGYLWAKTFEEFLKINQIKVYEEVLR